VKSICVYLWLKTMKIQHIAPRVHQLNLGFVNAYAIETLEESWVLVDSGLKINLAALQSLESHFGKPPIALLLTHGHIDHAGSAKELAEAWNLKIYASKMEKPFLTGQSIYPPYDPTVGGPLAQMSRIFPNAMFNFTGRLELYPDDGTLPFLSGWQVIDTPGHTPGHVSLWHEDDRVLLAGDALCTADFDSYLGMATQKKQFARGGSPFTPDWEASKTSVGKLADLEPSIVAAGHGQPISGADVADQMREFERHFEAPQHGRYVAEAARFDENGVTYLPPAPRDDFGKNAAKIGGAAALLMLGAKFLARRR